jgi:DnaK suppressor protein
MHLFPIIFQVLIIARQGKYLIKFISLPVFYLFIRFINLDSANNAIIMTQKERDMIREQLKHEISVLEKSIATLSELIDAEVQSDANDWFTSKESNPSKEINEMALEKAKQKIIILHNVLSRVDMPSYGICSRCNKPIPFERLKAIPATTRCLSCG